MLRGYIEKLTARQNLSYEEMHKAMMEILNGTASEIETAGFLVALKSKGETVEEITAAANVMREKATKVKAPSTAIDTCGTGGDGMGTFNISTIASLVVAGAGIPVAKHGNRSISSKSGSADLMEALGVRIPSSPEEVNASLAHVNFGFLFAPHFHRAMKNVARTRKELGIRTLFNLLGPLSNPAFVSYQIMGVYDDSMIRPLAEVLMNLGLRSAMVLHGHGGLDELSLSGPNHVVFFREGHMQEFYLSPEDVGLNRAPVSNLLAGSPQENAKIALEILNGKERGPKRDVVALNAGAAFLVVGAVKNLIEGVKLAIRVIDEGLAADVLYRIVKFTNSLGEAA